MSGIRASPHVGHRSEGREEITLDFDRAAIETPAFVYDEGEIARAALRISRIASEAGCLVLYTLKPFAFADALRLLVGQVAGFAVSSVFEATMARATLGVRGTVHFTSPGLCEEHLGAVLECCDYVSVNSLSQLGWLQPRLNGAVSPGIRVNPQLSFVPDARYDPCRAASRLGIPLAHLASTFAASPHDFDAVQGLHFHSNCDSEDVGQLNGTLRHIHETLGSRFFERMAWLNMGGGYLFSGNGDQADLCSAVDLVRSRYGLEVFVEPGAALVRSAGYMVSTVVDLFENDGHSIAVLDTTVNHMPEVFEYQFEPDVLGHSEDGEFDYTLTGCSCLAGDIFGQYSFDEPLRIGSRVVFNNAGAYSLVKAHMFNGINLPSIYARTPSGAVVLKRRFSYEDFASRCGIPPP
jgi:carboxynorspermidine decarboxylase